MKLSKMVQVINGEHTNILFSTVSRAVVTLDNAHYSALSDEATINSLFSPAERAFLVEKHFLVDNNLDEGKFVWHQLTSERLHPQSFNTYIALTSLCNFSCVYCYEKGQVSDASVMSDGVISEVIKWYKNIFSSGDYSKGTIVLYGGEPLYDIELLKTFIDAVTSISESTNFELSFNIITNGYLLEPAILDYLVAHRLREIQVTLDGPKEAHDKRRMLADGFGTFDTIIRNIMYVAQNTAVDITVRISFDESNLNSIFELLQYLTSIDLNKRVYVYFAPIHQTTVQQSSSCSFCSQNVTGSYGAVLEAYKLLYGKANEYGFRYPSYYTNGPCMTTSKDSSLIAPDGRLYKCVEMIDIDDLCIGSVEAGYSSRYYHFVYASQILPCLEKGCLYLPICGGGCQMESFLRYGGKIDKAVCHKLIFDGLNDFLLRMKYDLPVGTTKGGE